MPVKHTIKLRRDTGANWEAKNPVLSAGEVALDSTKNAYKVGDGTKTWKQLSYLMPGNLTAIRSGTSSVTFDTVNGNVEIGVNGNATLVEFGKDNSFINNELELDGDYLTGTMTMTTDANGDPIPDTIVTWGNMLITHDLFVLGAVTSSVDQPTFNVPENIANLGFNNITDIVDIGIIANANNGTANFHTGFYRDASDAGTFKFFNNLTEYPNGRPVASGSLTLADIEVGGVDATLLLTGSNASANNVFATGVFQGDASNITQATPSNGVAGGSSNIFINNNSNINLSMGGVANVGVVTKTGLTTSLNVSVSGNSNLNSASNLTITGGTAGQFAKTDGNGNVTWSAFVTDRIANGTSNVLANTQHGVIHASVNGHVDAATFSGTGLGSDLPVTITGNISAANIVATGSITGTLNEDSNAQPNVTSLGTLTSLTVDGDPSANGSYANVVLGSVNGNLNLGPAGNIKITGGTSGYSIQTDGAGNVTFWENANFVGAPWAITNSYGVGQVIKYKGSLYIANDDIPANYGFSLGVSGKTWKPLGGLTYTHTSTLTNGVADAALDPAAIDISAAINVPQITPNIYYTLMAPTSPAPRILTINNTGTEAFYINGDYRLAPNYSVVAVWTGTAWQFAAVNPGISNWYFNEAATGLSYSGKGGTFYAVDTTLTSIGNAVAPQNVEGFISGVLSGTGSFQAYGGGNIKLTNLNTYTGSTNVKYSTRMTYLDNGGLGTAVANTTQTYASTGTISIVGNTVTRTFSADSMMVFPVTSVPTTYAANLFVVAGGGGGGAGSLAVNDLLVNGKGGGGGAGGEVISASVIVTPGTVLEFTIGQGGSGGVTDSESGDQGGATTVTVIEGSMTYANATPITSLVARGGRGGGGGQSFTQQNRGGVGWDVASGGSSTDTVYGANDRTAAGTGFTSTITNTQFAVGGGSGGSANQTGTTVANGASGGNGSTNRSTDATSGASASSGTGSGGGGGAGQSHGRAGSPGGNGGSGQVQIQFQTKQGGSLATGGVSTSAGTTTIHTFSGDGLFTIPLTSTISNVRYLMVGGGGGGAGVEDSSTTGSGWGGGEGGEVKTGYITVTPGQTLNITVGAGGGYTKVGTALQGQKGGNTVISGQGFTTLTAVGGNGASAKPGGTGGPGADGGAGLTGNGGNGGTGTSNDITGLTVFYGGGGGGGRGGSGTTAGSGGNGGGGSGGGISQVGANGLTGGGGGGAGASNGVAGAFPGGSGGKGLVVFSYTTPINAYDVTTNSPYSIEGVFEHDAYNNQIFTNTLQGNGSYEKKRYTVDTFTNFVNLAGNVKVQQGILRIGNGSSTSMNMGSNVETSDNTETIFYSPATVAGRYNVYRPISGAGNVIFDSPSSTQGQYSMTSTLAGVTGNLIIRPLAALTGSTAVNFPANITVDNGGALHANSSVSVWSGNATISGNGQAFYGVTGAIGIESGSTLSANIKMLADSKIYIYANAGSNTASTTTISSAITGDKIMYLQTATMNPVSLTGSIDSTQPLTLVSGNYTFATTFNTNPSMGVDIRSGTNVILTEDVTWGNLNSETNTTITAPSATTVITLGYNHRSATMRSNIKLGSINKVGTGTQAIDVDILPTTLANVTGNTTVTAGILDVGGNTNGGYLPFGNINVAANSVLRLSRTDLISKGNTAVNAFQQGIPLNQNIIGTGNIELYGNIQQSECTGYYPGLYYPAQENHTMPDNTGFTGNLLINAGSKWSVFSDVDRFSNVIVGSNGALHLKAYYNESVFRTSGTFTVPTGTTYTAQYVVIGGGGGGGGGVYYSSGSINYRAGGGGGGGGIASGRNTALAPSTYTITVGAGGTSGPSRTDGTDWPTLGGVGGTSSAFGLTATGGQGGRASTYAANGSVGTPGASTGGQGQWSATNGTVNQNAGQGALSTVTTANTYWQSTRWATAGSGGLSGIWTVVQNSTTTSASPAGALGARGTTAPTVPTEWGGGGGGGGVTRNADNTGFITHNGGVGANGAVGILWYNNATEFVYTPNVSITGNGTQEGGVQYGAINCTDGNWNLTGNITVATTGGVTDTKIYANKQVRFTGQNITGSANLNIDGTAGGLVVLATTTNTMNGNIKCYYGQNLAFNTSISTGCAANIIVQAWSGQSSTLHIGQTESNIAFTTSGNLNVQTNGRVKFYSQGTNQLSSINVNNLTVGTSWTVDIIGNLTQNGVYTIIGSTQTLPSTVPSVGIVPTGKTVVFSYVNGTGLVATVS